MSWSRWTAVALVLLVHVKMAMTAQTPPAEAEFRAQIQRLDQKNDQAVRLQALNWLIEHRATKHAELALPALEKIIRRDPDDKVRESAVVAMHRVARKQGKPCPLVLLEAMLDKDVYVRQAAGSLCGEFTTFAPGAVPVLLRGAWSEDEAVRSDSLRVLAGAAPRDEVVLGVIETAKRDKIFIVRHNAYCAKFKANDKLDEFLAWIVRLQEDEKGVLHPVPEDRELRLRNQTTRNLAVIGTATLIMEWCDKRPEELAGALLHLLGDETPEIRRGAARLIGAAFLKATPPEPGKSGEDFSAKALSYLYPDTPSGQPKPASRAGLSSEKSKAGLCLEKCKVRERLKKLSENDPDASVRAAARQSIERLARAAEKTR